MSRLTLSSLLGTWCLLSTFAQSSESILLDSEIARFWIVSAEPSQSGRIQVIFCAFDSAGLPFSGLRQDMVSVREGNEERTIVSFGQHLESENIHLDLTFDKSGSMELDSAQFIRLGGTFEPQGKWPTEFPIGYEPPIEFAKRGVHHLLDSEIERISFLAFNESIYPILRNKKSIARFLDSVQPDGGTAYFDALLQTLKAQQKKESYKDVSAIVSLTDGHDNRSKSTIFEVVKKAQKSRVPIFTIGLGNGNKDELRFIAEQTGGEFHFTNSPASLVNIYEDIARNVQAYYHLEFEHPSLSSLTNTDTIRLSIQGQSNWASYPAAIDKALRDRVLSIQKAREEKRNNDAPPSWFWPLAGGAIMLVVVGRRRRKRFKLMTMTPTQPSSGQIVRVKMSDELSSVDIDIQGDYEKCALTRIDATTYEFTLPSAAQGRVHLRFTSEKGKTVVRKTTMKKG